MKAKRQRGRPRKDIPGEQVRKLAALGCSAIEIADVLGCHRDTLAANYSTQIDKGKSQLRIRLRRQLLKHALRENPAPAVLIFALKSICGLSEEPAPPAATVEFCVIQPSGAIPCGCDEGKGPVASCSICGGRGTLPTQVANA